MLSAQDETAMPPQGGTIRRIFQGVSRTQYETAESDCHIRFEARRAYQVFPKTRVLSGFAQATVMRRHLPIHREPIGWNGGDAFTIGTTGPNERA
jgi:hypothetical protein